MSHQSIILRRQAASLALRSSRQRPLSTVAALAGRLGKSADGADQTTAAWMARRCSRHHWNALDAPAFRWFSSEVGDQRTKDPKKGGQDAPPPAQEKGPKAEGSSKKRAEEKEECPTWQNPLHHDNPDNEKIMISDFGPDEAIPFVEAPPLADPNDPNKLLASQEVYDLADEIVTLSMLEMKELVTKIGDHFGFEKPPFTGPGGGSGGGGVEDDGDDGAAEAAPAKTAFDLKLVSFDEKSKIKVIKEVRAIANLGLKESKELVEGAPKVVMKDINKELAEELKAKLEAVGAVVEVV